VNLSEGPTEFYVIFGESVEQEGIRRPDDPGVIQYLDGQVRSVIPAMRRTGSPTAVSMVKGTGALMDWEGKNQRGETVRARAYACIINGFGVALVGVGLEERLEARDGDLRQMFSTFGFGEGKRDPELVESWALVSTYSIWNTSPFETDSSRARAVSETQSALVLGADGKWTRTSISEFIAMGAGMVISSGPEKKVSRGRWYAADGVLHLISEQDSWEDYQYQLARTTEGRQLKLVSGKTGEIWKPGR
jgi:hypothetical protein